MKTSMALLIVTALVAGCSVSSDDRASDKAGGSDAPVVLRMAYPYKANDGQPDEPALRYFADRVAEVSDGRVRVRISFNAAGDDVPGTEKKVARMVQSGQFDLAWIAARAWDQFGVRSFQALQAPFLITDYALLGRVAESPLAGEMLGGLKPLELTGLAIMPELLRHPAAREDALVSLEDFDGARIRDIPSRATDLLLSALGATPVHVENASFGRELARGSIDGLETSTARAIPGWTVTGNITFFGKANTVVANTEALEDLTGEQRDALTRAAEQTVQHLADDPPSERALARQFCAGGEVVLASDAQLDELRRAGRPVYALLEHDELTRSLIAAIREMKRSQPAEPAPVAAPCEHAEPRVADEVQSPDALDGTYRWKLTAAGARRAGTPGDPDIGSVVTMTLRGGRWLLGTNAFDSGTFEVRGNRLVFDWPNTGTVLTFTFKRADNGSLDIKPVLPMDRGDQFVWASAPWRRVGPPVRDVP
jgi:TRAP-type C4-dicarboxylate transport system substrate-binding protein